MTAAAPPALVAVSSAFNEFEMPAVSTPIAPVFRPAPEVRRPSFAPPARVAARPVRLAVRVGRPFGASLLHWLPRVTATVALGAALYAAAVTGRSHWQEWMASPEAGPDTAPKAAAAAVAPVKRTGRKRTGQLVVSSASGTARVLVDGVERGMTPLTLDDVPVGPHVVALQSATGTVERSVTVDVNRPARVDETIFPGWVLVTAPVDLAVTEGTRLIRLDDLGQAMLSPGHHELHLENRALGFSELRQVDVRPGETLRLSITPPRSTISVTAADPAEVWIDGAAAGLTPLVDFPVGIGTHDVRLRGAAGERRVTAVVTVKPLDLKVD